MSTPATAFALGNPASDGVAQQASKSLNLPANMSIPPLNFTSSSSAKSGDIWSTMDASNLGSGFSVNYGSGLGVGSGSSGLLWLAAAAIVGVLLWKKRST